MRHTPQVDTRTRISCGPGPGGSRVGARRAVFALATGPGRSTIQQRIARQLAGRLRSIPGAVGGDDGGNECGVDQASGARRHRRRTDRSAVPALAAADREDRRHAANRGRRARRRSRSSAITERPDHARPTRHRAGYASRADLLRDLASFRDDGRLYRIELQLAGPDPRVVLRERARSRPPTRSRSSTRRLAPVRRREHARPVDDGDAAS